MRRLLIKVSPEIKGSPEIKPLDKRVELSVLFDEALFVALLTLGLLVSLPGMMLGLLLTLGLLVSLPGMMKLLFDPLLLLVELD